jgi:hypothetical protein
MNNTTRFNTYLAALQQYITREGSAHVPAHHEESVDGGSVQLGTWIGYVRQRYKNNKLPVERVEILNNIPGNAEIAELSTSGQSLTQIADRYNLSRQRIHQIVKHTAKQSH